MFGQGLQRKAFEQGRGRLTESLEGSYAYSHVTGDAVARQNSASYHLDRHAGLRLPNMGAKANWVLQRH